MRHLELIQVWFLLSISLLIVGDDRTRNRTWIKSRKRTEHVFVTLFLFGEKWWGNAKLTSTIRSFCERIINQALMKSVAAFSSQTRFCERAKQTPIIKGLLTRVKILQAQGSKFIPGDRTLWELSKKSLIPLEFLSQNNFRGANVRWLMRFSCIYTRPTLSLIYYFPPYLASPHLLFCSRTVFNLRVLF